MFLLDMVLLPEHLTRGNDVEHRLLDAVAPVGIEESIAVGLGVQIEIQRPRAPEEVDVAVAHAAVAKIDEAGELPAIQHHVGQAIIAVQQRIGLEQMATLLNHAVCLLSARVAKAVGEVRGVVVARVIIAFYRGKIVRRVVGNGTAVCRQLVERAQASRSGWAR